MWKKGIHHGDISLGNLMWDERRKVGVLNDFDLAKFADKTGASGQDNTGTLPFMALEFMSEKGLRGEIPRRYRHEAESFTWSLICLYFATVKDPEGKNGTRDPHPLIEWFQNWKISRDAKKGLEWRDDDVAGVPLTYPNTRELACTLHKYWLDLYRSQFLGGAKSTRKFGTGRIMQILNPKMTRPVEFPPYEEPEDENLFRELVVMHDVILDDFKPIEGFVTEMSIRYNDFDWTA